MAYEYHVLYVRANKNTYSGLPDDINIKLNELGKAGWEIDKIVPKLRGGIFLLGIGRLDQTVAYLIFLKKEI